MGLHGSLSALVVFHISCRTCFVCVYICTLLHLHGQFKATRKHGTQIYFGTGLGYVSHQLYQTKRSANDYSFVIGTTYTMFIKGFTATATITTTTTTNNNNRLVLPVLLLVSLAQVLLLLLLLIIIIITTD